MNCKGIEHIYAVPAEIFPKKKVWQSTDNIDSYNSENLQTVLFLFGEQQHKDVAVKSYRYKINYIQPLHSLAGLTTNSRCYN